MTEKAKKLSPPYATYGSFIGFLNKLRETGIPNRIDQTVFGNASGSITYSVLAALKYLNLIDEEGNPSGFFQSLVNADDEARKAMLKTLLMKGYPTLFSDNFSLSNVSAGQFNDHIRDEYQVQGSTIDKIAAFFIAAANDAEIPISQHLKDRKPLHSSSSSRKSAKQRKTDQGAGSSSDRQREQIKPEIQKPLQYQLIDLMSEPDIDDDIKQSIWSLVQYLTAREAGKNDQN